MPAVRWNATVVDSPGFDPYTIVGDLVVAVRTPRSRDFVTFEVASAAQCAPDISRRPNVLLAPRPYPCLPAQWEGEVHVGDPVDFQIAGSSYRLTLARVAERPEGLPWIACDISLERD
jgi:hypothetical protein